MFATDRDGRRGLGGRSPARLRFVENPSLDARPWMLDGMNTQIVLGAAGSESPRRPPAKTAWSPSSVGCLAPFGSPLAKVGLRGWRAASKQAVAGVWLQENKNKKCSFVRLGSVSVCWRRASGMDHGSYRQHPTGTSIARSRAEWVRGPLSVELGNRDAMRETARCARVDDRSLSLPTAHSLLEAAHPHYMLAPSTSRRRNPHPHRSLVWTGKPQSSPVN